MIGTESGPLNGTCNDWIWYHQSCPVNYNPQVSRCMQCSLTQPTANPHCIWRSCDRHCGCMGQHTAWRVLCPVLSTRRSLVCCHSTCDTILLQRQLQPRRYVVCGFACDLMMRRRALVLQCHADQPGSLHHIRVQCHDWRQQLCDIQLHDSACWIGLGAEVHCLRRHGPSWGRHDPSDG